MPRQKHQSSEEMLQLLSNVDVNSNVAVYLQLENQIQFAITAGRLEAGVQLPSVRELSERLEVNPNTVAKAYRDLEVMDILYTRRGKGVFVCDGVQQKCRDYCLHRIVSRTHEVMLEARVAGMDTKLVMDIVKQCLAANGSPYAQPPASLYKLARKAIK